MSLCDIEGWGYEEFGESLPDLLLEADEPTVLDPRRHQMSLSLSLASASVEGPEISYFCSHNLESSNDNSAMTEENSILPPIVLSTEESEDEILNEEPASRTLNLKSACVEGPEISCISSPHNLQSSNDNNAMTEDNSMLSPIVLSTEEPEDDIEILHEEPEDDIEILHDEPASRPRVREPRRSKLHDRAHRSKKKKGPEMCENCKEWFVSRDSLMKHLAVYFTRSKPKSFVCEKCGKKYSSSVHLANHLLIHTGEMPYKCMFCKGKFRTKRQARVCEIGHLNNRFKL